LALTNSEAEALGHAATQAPQPMHAAASMALSAAILGTGTALPSGAEPTLADTKPPFCWMRSKAVRSTTRSLMMGNGPARNGSTVTVSPSLKLRICTSQVVVAPWIPWATPLITSPQVPQIPSRQSLPNSTASSPFLTRSSLRMSSISRKDISGRTPSTL